MGHRSNLYLQSSKRTIPIFEANNSLPFFWLCLLDLHTLRAKFWDWEDAFAREELAGEEEEEAEWSAEGPSTNLILSKHLFWGNADRSHAFLKTHFPDCLPLFTLFVSCIKGNWETADNLELDITQFSAFYESLGEFCEALQREVAAIENNRPGEISFLLPTDLIAGGTGFATSENSEFAALDAYKEALEDRKVPTQKERVPKAGPKSLLVAISVLLLCPGFSYGVYKGYLKEGWSGSVVAIAFLNLLFYVFSLWFIIAELKVRRKSNT
jgi:hypothetical protein